MDEIVIIGIVLTVLGVLILATSISLMVLIIKLLRKRQYGIKRWIIVTTLLFFFVVGYIINALEIMEIEIIPIPPILMVSLVYFFGAIFTLVTIWSIRTLISDILGKEMSDKNAIEEFVKISGIDPEHKNLRVRNTFHCKHCEQDISFTIADVVRYHASTLERGIKVEEVFGTTSYVLRPVHKCKDGRREVNVIHDENLEVRSIEDSRLLFGDAI